MRRLRAFTRVRLFDRQRRTIPAARLSRVAREALRFGRWKGGPVDVTFVDDETLRALHEEHLDDPRGTDVLAFDYGGGPSPIGADLIVSADRALAESRRRGHSFLEELALYVAHGCLHLTGYKDKTSAQARAMRRAEAGVLRRLGIPHRFRPGPPL
ncbi:MAG: rRNA maturation RNase YbeY [Planctomycetota bacterium]